MADLAVGDRRKPNDRLGRAISSDVFALGGAVTLAGLLFLNPYLLTALIGLPVLWVILRVLPPRPKTKIFAAVRLLSGLQDRNQTQATTPLWLLILRLVAVACLILGLSGPRWAPNGEQSSPERMLIVLDGGWAQSQTQSVIRDRLGQILGASQFSQTQFAVLSLAEPKPIDWQNSSTVSGEVQNWQSQPIDPVWDRAIKILDDITFDFETLWMVDGLKYSGKRAEFYNALRAKGPVEIFDPKPSMYLIDGFDQDGTDLGITLQMISGKDTGDHMLQIHGTDPAGQPIIIAQNPLNSDQKQIFDVPRELQSRIIKFQITNQHHVGATYVLADQLRRPQVGLMTRTSGNETINVLDPLHYTANAIAPFGDIVSGTVEKLMMLNPDVLIATDEIDPVHQDAILEWVNSGGHLVRFAGPLMVRDGLRSNGDDLLPVKLRQGGRNLGGAMSWDIPKTISQFTSESPFYGLAVPSDLRISTQVLAEPSPDLNDKVIAKLADQTPLVTQSHSGQGMITFFHVTATPQWSNLPLTGLFVEMLQRLVRPNLASVTKELPADVQWTLRYALNQDGSLSPRNDLTGISTDDLNAPLISRSVPLGIYTAQDFSISRNVADTGRRIELMDWPSDWSVKSDISVDQMRNFGPILLLVAFALLVVDIFASLFVSGRLFVAVILALIALQPVTDPVFASEFDPAGEITLAHVKTGIKRVDDLAQAGLWGLSDTLFFRTSIEPAPPVMVDVERDELAFFPLLYWPIVAGQLVPSDQAYKKLNAYLASGGVILFDTQDQGIIRDQANPELRKILAPLNIPPLEPVPDDHVLTRAFYLLNEFPGRFAQGDLWVEAARDNSRVQGVPFRSLNDGVTPVLIGSNDWAAAWAMDERGEPLIKIGQGFAGERQREIAFRFGINLVMHVLTGNYKSDQVHVPALLNRLGQE